MYSQEFQESLKAVEAARKENIAYEPKRMTAKEKDDLLAAYHPDYKKSEFSELSIGPNKGEKVPHELCAMLEAHSRIKAEDVDLKNVAYDVDVLIIGGGGAGASAAIEADNAGAKAMIVTKLRIGDANTMMAEGGIQAADKENDSPAIHFLDAFGGGHFAAKRDLLAKLVCDAPGAIKWLNELGVEFDKAEDGTMITTHGGGTSRKRMHAAKDYSGAEIMRTLRDEVINRGIPVVDFTAAIELILDENGNAAGAVLMNMETQELMVAKAKTVIIATGGAGRMHYQGFPTSNHYGATADGLVLGYRAGAKLLYADTLQYHPTGAAFPQQIFGALVTEKVRSLGAKLINRDGKVYLEVAPVLVDAKDPLYAVTDVFNGIEVVGNMLGTSMFYGSGAGKLPTASAVVGDMISAVRFGDEPEKIGWGSEELEVHKASELPRKYFARFEGSRSEKKEIVEENLGKVKWVVLEGKDEFAVLTGQMTGDAFDAAAEKIGGLRQKLAARV